MIQKVSQLPSKQHYNMLHAGNYELTNSLLFADMTQNTQDFIMVNSCQQYGE